MPKNPHLWIHDGTILGMTLPGTSLTWYTWKQTADSSPPLSKSYYEYPLRQVPHVASQSPPFPSPILLPLKVMIQSWKYWKEATHLGVPGETKHLTPNFWFPDFIGQTFETAEVIPLEFLAFLSFSNLSSSAFALAAACSPWEKAEFEILGSQLSHWSENSLGMSWSFQLPDLISFGPYKVDEKTETEIPGFKNSKMFGKFSPLPYPGKNDPNLTCAYCSNGLGWSHQLEISHLGYYDNNRNLWQRVGWSPGSTTVIF